MENARIRITAHVCYVWGYDLSAYFGDVSQGRLIQVTLFCAGIGTLFFHFMSKFKVPAFLGSSFAFLGGFATVAKFDSGIYATMSGDEKLS